MKDFIVCLIMFAIFAGSCFAASGDKVNQMVLRFHNLSGSSKPAQSPGEMRFNGTYIFVNISSAAHPSWRRIAVGNGF